MRNSIGIKYSPKKSGIEKIVGSMYADRYERRREHAPIISVILNIIPNSKGVLLLLTFITIYVLILCVNSIVLFPNKNEDKTKKHSS